MSDLQPTLDHFWNIATRTCDEVQGFQPNLVITLMHSGWAPLFVAVELWKRTQSQPFPPIVRTNIGREKLARYNQLESRRGQTKTFIGELEGSVEIGHFLAWLVDQKKWQEELSMQIAEELWPATPERILVVDECISEGSTWILTLGLLHDIFPDAQVHFIADREQGWPTAFLKAWARRYHPGLLDALETGAEQFGSYGSPEMRQASHLVNATGDIDLESLAWQPLTAGSEVIRALSQYLPAQAWLELHGFVERTLAAEIARKAPEYIPNCVASGKTWRRLASGWLVLREIHRNGPLTRPQMMEALGWSEGKTSKQLLRQIEAGNLVVRKVGRINRYQFSPSATDGYWSKERPILDNYWVIPNRLMAGAFPGFGQESDMKALLPRLDWLLQAGMSFFLDLTSEYEHKPDSYDRIVREQAESLGIAVEYCAIPTALRRLPKRKQVTAMLDAIDRALADGQNVYLHCLDGQELTGIVVGCYLARHGMSGAQALREIERLRANTFDAWLRSPVSERARRLVRSWQVGE